MAKINATSVVSKKGTLLLAALALCVATCGDVAEAQASQPLWGTNIVTTVSKPANPVSLIPNQKAFSSGLPMNGASLSDDALSEVSGKGIPLMVPKYANQRGNDVVLWDELPRPSRGAGASSISSIGNQQTISMSVSR
ncbi:MAG: hypothetical protein AB7C98_01600 [Acidithiobacillus sp.]